MAEEIEDVGRRERDGLISYLARLVEHLWKLPRWTSMRSRNQRIWHAEIDAYRQRTKRSLEENPGLKGSLTQFFHEAWEEAVLELAKDAAKISIRDSHFAELANHRAYPTDCPWTPEQALDEDFWPDLEKNGNPT